MHVLEIARGFGVALNEFGDKLVKAFGSSFSPSEQAYSYNVEPVEYGGTALSDGGSTTKTISIETDSYFVCEKITDDLVVASATRGAYTLQILDSGSSKVWYNQPVARAAGVGTMLGAGATNSLAASGPFFFSKPILVKPGSSLKLTVKNISGVNINFLQIALHGWKVTDPKDFEMRLRR